MPTPISNLNFSATEYGLMLGAIKSFDVNEVGFSRRKASQFKRLASSCYDKIAHDEFFNLTPYELGVLIIIINFALERLDNYVHIPEALNNKLMLQGALSKINIFAEQKGLSKY